jgi:hypothetical protein
VLNQPKIKGNYVEVEVTPSHGSRISNTLTARGVIHLMVYKAPQLAIISLRKASKLDLDKALAGLCPELDATKLS